MGITCGTLHAVVHVDVGLVHMHMSHACTGKVQYNSLSLTVQLPLMYSTNACHVRTKASRVQYKCLYCPYNSLSFTVQMLLMSVQKPLMSTQKPLLYSTNACHVQYTH